MAKIAFATEERFHRITLNDPPLNILDLEMLGELRDALRNVSNDRAILVIEGAGEKAFSAGASVQDHLGETVREMLERFHDCFRILNRLDLITIALVRGAALGGGCELALGCDFVLASERAKFSQPEINLGVFPPVAAYQLSRQVPPRIGLELLLAGDAVDSHSAKAIGMVNAVFPDAAFDSRADEWIDRLLRHSPSSLRFARKAFRLAATDDFEEKLSAVESMYLGELMASDDANEGLRAFLDKRKPVWKGK